MRIKRIKADIMSSFLRFMLMLYAISPITERKEWLFNIYVILGISLGVIGIGYAIYLACKKTKAFTSFMIGTPKDNLTDLMIAIAGLTVCYSMDLPGDAWIWWILLVASLLELFYPTKI